MTKAELIKIAKPILFNTDNVKAILDGRKTQTRRIIKLKYDNTHHEIKTDKYGTRLIEIENDIEGVTYGTREDGTTWRKIRGYIEPKPPYKKGDIIYIRETYDYLEGRKIGDHAIDGKFFYKADGDLRPVSWRGNWAPSIHMPTIAARIFLRVTDVRAERLQDINDEQAKAEGANWKNGKHVGFEEKMRRSAVDRFAEIWDSAIKKSDIDRYGWEANPWVWVIEFEVVKICP